MRRHGIVTVLTAALTVLSAKSESLSRDQLFSTKPNQHQKSVLQNTVKALLDFEHLPKDGEALRPLSKTANAASKYMRTLFRRYQDNSIDKSDGNLVRSIVPIVGDHHNQHGMLVFKLKHLMKRSDKLLSAELHYNLRGQKRSLKSVAGKRRSTDVEPVVADTAVSMNEMVTTPSWKTWDAKQAVNSALARAHQDDTDILLALQFYKLNRRGRRRTAPMDSTKVLRRHTPFLLVHSEAPTSIDEQQVMNALFEEDVRLLDATRPKSRGKRRVSATLYSYRVATAQRQADAPPPDTKSAIDRRAELHLNAFQSQGPETLQSRKELRRRRKFRERQRQRIRQLGQKANELPYPDGYSEFGSRWENTYAHPRPQQNGSDVEKHNPNYYHTGSASSGHSGDVQVFLLGEHKSVAPVNCRKRRLTVQFRDIGWGHWVIAPKTFDAHFCAGECPFPLETEVNPSNHAIIQSIVQQIGLNPYVPPVCCAPDRMDSLTLLYFDEDDNVVLKNYPKMIVKSCGCL